MVGRIYHVGLTVSDLDKSIAFYRDILGLKYQGEIMMVGEETDKMFQKKNCKARVAYLNGSENIETPPDVLINYEKYSKKIDSIYNSKFEKEIKPLIVPAVTIEKEEERLGKLISLLKSRREKS